MTHLYHKIESKIDGLWIDTLTITKNSDDEEYPRGIVQLVHGMAEYKERYIPFMEFLASKGFVCVIHDHRGHGESVKSKADYGYLYDTTGNALVADTHQVTEMVKEDYPDLPLYLFGHSMGSLVVRAYTKKYDKELKGLIVCGSPSANPMAGVAKKMAAGVLKVFGPRASGKLFHKLAFAGYLKDIEAPQSENDWLSVNRDNVTAYDEDPKCGFMFTANGFLNLFRVMEDAYSEEGWALKNQDLPVFFISGAQDPCMISQDAFEDAIRFMRKVGYENTKAKLYEGMRHEILNEDDHNIVYQDVLTLLERFENGGSIDDEKNV